MSYKPEVIDFSVFKNKIGKYDLDCQKLDIIFNRGDSRLWTALVSPGKHNVVVTYHLNKSDIGDNVFDIISEKKVILDVEEEDVYQTIDLLVSHTTPTSTPETDNE